MNWKRKYKANNYLYDFQKSETIRSFGDSIYTGEINIDKLKKILKRYGKI